MTNGTIEERIYKLVKKKEALFAQVVDGLSVPAEQIGKITEDEIFALMGLTKRKTPPKQCFSEVLLNDINYF